MGNLPGPTIIVVAALLFLLILIGAIIAVVIAIRRNSALKRAQAASVSLPSQPATVGQGYSSHPTTSDQPEHPQAPDATTNEPASPQTDTHPQGY